MSDEFDPTPYVRPPIVDVPSGVALGIALLSAAPKPAPAHVEAAAKKVHAETVALQAAWAKADGGPVQTDKRKADMRIDNAWGILLDRLEAYASLPIEKFSKAARARVLIDTVSKSREWLKMPYGAEWAESGKRLQKIDEEGLAPDIEALAGPEFLKEVRQAHKAYGIALGVTEAAPEALDALGDDVAEHAFFVLALVLGVADEHRLDEALVRGEGRGRVALRDEALADGRDRAELGHHGHHRAPLAPVPTEDGVEEPKNRRVEIYLRKVKV